MAKEKTPNKLEEVKILINNLTADSAAEIADIAEQLEAARAKKAAADQSIEDAIKCTNADVFRKAKADAAETATIIEMYEARLDQLRKKEFITEAASDEVIDSLIDYQNARTAEFIKAIKAPADQLKALYTKYAQDYREAVNTVNTWTGTIHANYRKPGTTFPDGSHRSPKPEPVTGLTGFFPAFCTEATRTEEYLNAIDSANRQTK